MLPAGGEVESLEESSWRPRPGECQLVIHLQHHLLESLSFLSDQLFQKILRLPGHRWAIGHS